MKRLKITIVIISNLILFIGCSKKEVYIKPMCPYIEPIDLTIKTNSKGGLNKNETKKVFEALRYYKKETIRLKKEVKK